MSVASKIPVAEWNKHKDVLRHLYKTEPLNEVVTKAAADHGFHASKAQFIRKFRNWGFEKNSTSDQWKKVAKQVRKRKAQGKESEVSIKHQRISDRKLRKELSRYDVREDTENHSSPNDEKRGDVDVRTPQAENIVIIDFDHIPWFKFQGLIEPYFTRLRASEAKARASGQSSPLKKRSQVCDLLSGMGSSLDLEPWDYPSSGTRPRPGVEDRQSNVFQVPDNRVPVNADPVRALESKQSKTSGEVLSLFAECVGAHVTSYGTSDYREVIASHLNDFLIERHDGELRSDVGRVNLSSNPEITFQLIRYSVYLSSNNLLSNSAIDGITTFVKRSAEQIALKTLLSLGTPSAMIFGSHLLVSAARLGHIGFVQTLLDEGVDISTLAGKSLRTSALQEAVRSDKVSMVRLLLERGAEPIESREILHHALLGTHSSEVVQLLVEKGADVHERSQGDTTVLAAAARHCGSTVVRTLLDAGARVNEITNSLATLQAAATNFEVDVTQTLIDAGADINAPTETYYEGARQQRVGYPSDEHFATPVQRASFIGNTEVVQILVSEGAIIDACPWIEWSKKRSAERGWRIVAPQAYELTALEAAVSSSNKALVRILLEAGADVNGRGAMNTPLQMAACEKDADLVDILLRYGAEVNAPSRTPNGRTALQGAAERGNCNLVKRLLYLGADVNAPASLYYGRTALQAAIEQDFPEVTRLLIEFGADVNANPSREGGLTCLQAAIQARRVELVLFLLDRGADPNGTVTIFGKQTPIQTAVHSLNPFDTGWHQSTWRTPSSPELVMVQALLNAGADVNTLVYSNRGLSALEAAVQCSDTEIVQILLHRGANPKDHSRYTSALIQAATSTSTQLVHLLISAGADVNQYIPHNDFKDAPEFARCGSELAPRSALQGAALEDRLSTAKALLDAGAQCSAGSSNPDFPDALRGACHSSIGMMKLLLAKGADPNALNANHCDSALGIVLSTQSRWDRAEKASMLIEAGADVNRTKPGMKHLLSLAARPADIEIVRSLLEAGACIKPNLDADSQILPDLLDPHNTMERPTQDPEIFRLLIDAGADVNARSSKISGATVLQQAASTCDLQLLELLLSNGAEVNAPANHFRGVTALQAAVLRGNLKMALVLLRAGAKITAPGAATEGRTALEAAAEHGRLDILSLLLRNYDVSETIESDCKGAAKFAFKEGHNLIGGLLRDYKRGHDLTGEPSF